jgi:Holliday junction resolvase RusA-like endonuclease
VRLSLVDVTHHQTPVPKGRPRVGHGRVYTPPRTAAAEEALGWVLRAAYKGAPTTAPCEVRLDFHVGSGQVPDLDNLVKLALDAANGIVWKDDRQVVAITARRHQRGPMSTIMRVDAIVDDAEQGSLTPD